MSMEVTDRKGTSVKESVGVTMRKGWVSVPRYLGTYELMREKGY